MKQNRIPKLVASHNLGRWDSDLFNRCSSIEHLMQSLDVIVLRKLNESLAGACMIAHTNYGSRNHSSMRFRST